MNKSSFAIAALSLALAGTVAAQAPQNPATNPGSQKVAPPQKFSALDSNKDGRVSREEARAHSELVSSFAELDTNKDTYLSEAEYGKWTPAPSSAMPASPAPAGEAATPPTRSPGNSSSNSSDDSQKSTPAGQ